MKKIIIIIMVILLISCEKKENVNKNTNIDKIPGNINEDVNIDINNITDNHDEIMYMNTVNEYAYILANNLRIRDKPSINGNIIDSISMKNVTIYAKHGTKRMIDGVWDYWYKISESQNHWVNAYYVATFPILFNSYNNYDGLDGLNKNYIIKNIDNDGIMDYLIVDLQGKHEGFNQINNELYNTIVDKPYLFRLSECIKDIKNQLNEDYIIRITHKNEQYSYNTVTYDITSFILYYELKIDNDVQTIINHIGKATSGSAASVIYYIVDVDRHYELTFSWWRDRYGISYKVYEIE